MHASDVATGLQRLNETPPKEKLISADQYIIESHRDSYIGRVNPHQMSASSISVLPYPQTIAEKDTIWVHSFMILPSEHTIISDMTHNTTLR